MNQTFFKIDPNNPLPLYIQIHRNLLNGIQSAILEPGSLLPSERDLSEWYGVNRMTLRQAISLLVNDGLLEKKRGLGTYVAVERKHPSLVTGVIGFTERMKLSGLNPTSVVIHQAKQTATFSVALALQIEEGDEIICLTRLRYIDGEPLMLETSYLSYEKYPDLLTVDFGRESLYRTLTDRYNVHIAETEHTLEPVLTKYDEAIALGIKPDAPAMLVHVYAYTYNHHAVEFSKSVIRGDRCRYYFKATTASHVPMR
jgi:GntR family transcriptional regulator